MADYQILKESVATVVRQNGNQEITGDLLQSALFSMINTLGAGYQFAGVASQAVIPGTPDAKLYYVAAGPGIYTAFNNLVVNDGELAFFFIPEGAAQWYKMSVPMGGSGYALFSPERFDADDLPARPTDGKKYFLIAYRVVSDLYREYIYVSEPNVNGGQWRAVRQLNNIDFVPGTDQTNTKAPTTVTAAYALNLINAAFPSWNLNFTSGDPASVTGDLQDFEDLFDIQDVAQDFLAKFGAATQPRLVIANRNQTQGNLMILNLTAFDKYDDYYHFVFGGVGGSEGYMIELTVHILSMSGDTVTSLYFELEFTEI